MYQFLSPDIRQQPDHLVGNSIPLVQIAKGGRQLSVSSTVLLDQKLGHSGVAFADPDRVLQFFLVNPHGLSTSLPECQAVTLARARGIRTNPKDIWNNFAHIAAADRILVQIPLLTGHAAD